MLDMLLKKSGSIETKNRRSFQWSDPCVRTAGVRGGVRQGGCTRCASHRHTCAVAFSIRYTCRNVTLLVAQVWETQTQR